MNLVCAAFSLALLFTVGATAAPTDDPALRKTFEARYTAVRAAIDNRDSKALAAFFAPNAIFVSVTCTTATSDTILKGDMGRRADPHDQSQTTVVSAKRDGSTAIVEQINEMKTARPGQGGKPLNIALRVGSTDTWVQIKGTWFLKRSATHLLDYAVNGKTVRHMEAAKTCS